jgi:2-octaprenylphenol hydroxylase
VNKTFDVVIIGAGVTGLTVAALLAQSPQGSRLRLTVIDAAARPVFSADDDVALRVSAVAMGSAALLESVGAWEFVRSSRVGAYDRMRVWDESGHADSSAALHFDAAEFGVPQLGFIVENVLLQQALLNVLDNSDVELIFEAPISALQKEEQKYKVAIENRMFDADLVIGADGARSFVRNSVGISTRDWPYGQSAIVTHLTPEKPHQNTAWQRFLRDGPLGMLPLSDGRISVVWSIGENTAERALAASDAELGEMLSAASDYVLHATNYVLPGIALIGDAAHAIHPLAGQGANLGLQDAAVLARVISTALAKDECPGDRPVLRRYERERKGENAQMMHLMTGLNRLFATDSTLVRELRVIGMRLFNNSGPIRDRAVKVALGVGQ